MDTLAKSWELTEDGHERRNRKVTPKGRPRIYCGTPVGRKVTAKLFLEPLAKFIRGDFEDKPPRPPGDLGAIVYKPYFQKTLALAALVPLLDAINRGWDGEDTESAAMMLRMKIGRYLRDRLALQNLLTSDDEGERAKGETARKIVLHPSHDKEKRKRQRKILWKYLKSDWETWKIVAAGSWLLECALSLDYFTQDERGFPKIAPDWQEDVDRIGEDILRVDQVMLPHTTPPPKWTGWLAKYNDRFEQTFVRDWRPQTKEAITRAFHNNPDFEHARGVNALQNVQFVIDEKMLKLAEDKAVLLMDHEGEQREDDERLVKADIRTAKWLGTRTFYQTYSCDKRGRVYPIPHFNYGREDHVRALFKFARWMPLGPDAGITWLEINAANCGGFEDVDKKPWKDRLRWAHDNRRMIQRIADDPYDTFDLWCSADRPLSYVGACRELAAAWADPDHFFTHLPIEFDGSANGIQHLALLARDPDAARRVNLVKADRPHDVYRDVEKHVRELLEADSDRWAAWWLERFKLLDAKVIRKLIKTPAMTFGYNATIPGMSDEIIKVGRDKKIFTRHPIGCGYGLGPTELPTCDCGAFYLAMKIRQACEKILSKPHDVMEYICKLSNHCTANSRPLEWTSPTGFPVANRYNKSNTETAYLTENGCNVEYIVADGCTDEILETKARNSSAPNFVHSQDAAHLIRIVNAARLDGISDFVTVHDAFAVHAPHAKRFNQIIREQLAEMYLGSNELDMLRSQNVSNADFEQPPAQGAFDPHEVRAAEYCWA